MSSWVRVAERKCCCRKYRIHAAAQAEYVGSLDAGFTTTIGEASVELFPKNDASTQTLTVNVDAAPLHPLTVTADHGTAPTPRPYTPGSLLHVHHTLRRLGQALVAVVDHQDDDTA
jgi:hypothetical protein